MPDYRINFTEADINSASNGKKKEKKIDDLYQELDALKAEYEDAVKSPSKLPDLELPDKLDLDKLEFEKKSEEELRQQAKTRLEAEYEKGIAELEKKTEDNIATLKYNIDSKKNAADSKRDTLEDTYGAKIKSAENTALKRGLARSSIITQQIEGLKNDRSSAVTDLDKGLITDIEYLQKKIEAASDRLNEAQNNFDGEMAAEIEKELLELIDQQEDRYQKVLKFNNDVEKKQADYLRQKEAALINRSQAENEQLKTSVLYGNEAARQNYAKNVMDAVSGYFEGMDRKDALNLLENDAKLKNALGVYYAVLKSSLKN